MAGDYSEACCMKITDRSDLSDSRAARDTLQQEALRSSTSKEAGLLAKKLRGSTEGTLIGNIAANPASDSVDVSLAKAISAQLSPEAMAAERRQRIESLKQQIAEGKYNPSSEAIAASVGEELMFEILGSGGAFSSKS